MADNLKEIIKKHAAELITTPLFMGFPMGDLVKFLANCRHTTHKVGDIICHEGAQSTNMSILITGRVGIYKQEMLINSLAAPALIGEMGLFTGTPRNATVKVETDASCLTINRDELTAIFQKEPKLSHKIYRNVILCLRNKINNDNQQILSLQSDLIDKEAENLKLKVAFMPDDLKEDDKLRAKDVFARQKRLSRNKRSNIRVSITQPKICFVKIDEKRFNAKDLSLSGMNIYVTDFSDSIVKKWRTGSPVQGEVCLLNQQPFPFSGVIKNIFKDHCGIKFNKRFTVSQETILIGMINALYRLGMVI